MNFGSITRRIRRCENEAAAQVVFEHAIATAIADAIKAEREACAVMCETKEIHFDIDEWLLSSKKRMTALTALALADAIRTRDAE